MVGPSLYYQWKTSPVYYHILKLMILSSRRSLVRFLLPLKNTIVRF
ncbi:hypothetical protein AAKU61_002562 [Undibacterium sp. GrIS 1.2]